jgi:phage baseplate assembly protein W
MAEAFVGSGLSFPLKTTASGAVALVSHDQELKESIRLILGTAYGERPMRPEFGCGIHALVFAPVKGGNDPRNLVFPFYTIPPEE